MEGVVGIDGVDQFSLFRAGCDGHRYELAVVGVESSQPRVLRELDEAAMRIACDSYLLIKRQPRRPSKELTTDTGLLLAARACSPKLH